MAGDQGVPPFDPAGAVYVYAAMADHIAARIAAGELRPDMRLPGERALAEEYGVALGTARRAMDVLRERGLVVTLPAKGTYVTGPASEA
jgi:GntR family transcriptional regulator